MSEHDSRVYFEAIAPPLEPGLPAVQESFQQLVEAERFLVLTGGHIEQRCMSGCCSRLVATIPAPAMEQCSFLAADGRFHA